MLSHPSPSLFKLSDSIEQSVGLACSKIAPSWPLDQSIAVNPYWGFVGKPIAEVAANLGRLSGSTMLMPLSWYKEQWQSGGLTEAAIHKAIERSDGVVSFEQVFSLLKGDAQAEAPSRVSLVSDLVDQSRDLSHAMAWGVYLTHNISQFCASFFDQGQSAWPSGNTQDLYQAWQTAAQKDHGPRLMMGAQGVRKAMATLPNSPHELLELATAELGVSSEQQHNYFTALLLSVNGWAAWCAYQRWQARLQEKDDNTIEHLLAIRLAWELVLLRTNKVKFSFQSKEHASSLTLQAHWLLQSAVEISYQSQFVSGLKSTLGQVPLTDLPKVQAVFCIDVRSEPYRRALESANKGIATLGFAGFFGLPIEYAPLGTDVRRTQLPGLLAAKLVVGDACDTPQETLANGNARKLRLGVQSAWDGFKRASTSGFSFVETLGIGYAAKLVKDSFAFNDTTSIDGAGLSEKETKQSKPRLLSHVDGASLTVDEEVGLAAKILRALSLEEGFARLVLLAGHGSVSNNNPAAASLDCGACCGQSGAVNARVLAGLLNKPEVRTGLNLLGINLTADTWFVAGLHNTTTDDVILFDESDVPQSHAADLKVLQENLAAAGKSARVARAKSLGLKATDKNLDEQVKQRARDWAQVRPEWGLANNAAFLVAPRARSQSLDLKGRSFLHEYNWQKDPGFGVLELVMTAPMIVTHWINMQYYASTVDNQRYGSGNKVLANVVGTNIGVFEGNGGDLRIGLSWQSVHDGETFRHAPLRLSVFVEAPQDTIEGILEKHAHVKQLVQNEWLHLFALDAAEQKVSQYHQGRWLAA
jgi:uncharacterized protein